MCSSVTAVTVRCELAGHTDPVTGDTTNRLTVYGAPWCADCRRTKCLLDRHAVPYDYIDIDQDHRLGNEPGPCRTVGTPSRSWCWPTAATCWNRLTLSWLPGSA
jgi:hypothetical protein